MTDQRHTDDGPVSSMDDTGIDLQTVLDALPRAIILTTPDGRIRSWNRQAERLYGWAPEEVVDRHGRCAGHRAATATPFGSG